MRLARWGVAAAWMAGPAWVLATRFDAVRFGHPAYSLVVAQARIVAAMRALLGQQDLD